MRRFLAIELDESTPDHSTISRTRRLIDLETQREVFTWVLRLLAKQGLLKGGTMAAVFGAPNVFASAVKAPGPRAIAIRLATLRLASRPHRLKTATCTTGC